MKKFSHLICLILAVSVMLSICAVAFAANDIDVEYEEETVTAIREDGDSAQHIVVAPLDPGVGGFFDPGPGPVPPIWGWRPGIPNPWFPS